MAKTILGVFEIRKNIFALGRQGKKAKAVCTFDKKRNGYIGVRGVKPTITEEAKRRAVSKACREALAALAA